MKQSPSVMMISDEQRTLWVAIRAAPEDDAPRLAYADWLDTNGDEDRAEFIRVQCALARLGTDRRKGRKDRIRLEPLEKALFTSHGARWFADLRKVLQGSNPFDREDQWLNRFQFRRGFISTSSFGLESARRLAAAGDTVEPVDSVCVMECGAHYCHESVRAITRWPGAGCVLSFSIAWGGDGDIDAITGSRHLRNLYHLGVWHGAVSDAGIAKLAAWPPGVTLRSADLKGNPITDEGAVALANSSYLGQLRRLDLHGTRIGEVGRQRLQERFGNALQI